MKKPKIKAFIRGWSSLFDLTGAFVSLPETLNGPARDAQALRSDWQAVGQDIRQGMNLATNSRVP